MAGEEVVLSTFDNRLTTNTTIQVNSTSMVYIQKLTINTLVSSFSDFRLATKLLSIQMILSDGERIQDIISSFTGYTISDIIPQLIQIEVICNYLITHKSGRTGEHCDPICHIFWLNLKPKTA
jgi:hypothetical protein